MNITQIYLFIKEITQISLLEMKRTQISIITRASMFSGTLEGPAHHVIKQFKITITNAVKI